MATITFQVVETGQTTATKTYTLPDANVDRLVLAYQQKGNVLINGAATRAQVLLAWATEMINNTIASVLNFESQNATSTALAGVSVITPV
jgi:hypothetical protein